MIITILNGYDKCTLAPATPPCPMPAIRTYYEILAVPHDADEATLRRAYRRAMQAVHPDRNPDGKRTARRTRHLNAAKETLLNPEKRKRYDVKLRRRGLIPDLPNKTSPDFPTQNPPQDHPAHNQASDFQFATESKSPPHKPPPRNSTESDFGPGRPTERKRPQPRRPTRKPKQHFKSSRTHTRLLSPKKILAAFCVIGCLVAFFLFPWLKIQRTIISWTRAIPSPPSISQLTTAQPVSPKPVSPKPVSPKPVSPRSTTPRPAIPRTTRPKLATPRPASPRTTPPRTTRPSAASAATPKIIEAKFDEAVRVNGPNKQVIVKGPCSELSVSGSGYQITIENMVSGKIKLSGFDHELTIRGTVSEIIGSGLRHQITAEEVGRVMMSGSGHKLYYQQGTGGLPIEEIPGNKSLDSQGRFFEIKKIQSMPEAPANSGTSKALNPIPD